FYRPIQTLGYAILRPCLRQVSQRRNVRQSWLSVRIEIRRHATAKFEVLARLIVTIVRKRVAAIARRQLPAQPILEQRTVIVAEQQSVAISFHRTNCQGRSAVQS